MDFMFWVWLAVVVVTAVVEFATMDLASIWFTAGAVIPFILSAIGGIHWAIQIVIFVVLSTLFIFLLRPLAKKYLLRNVNEKTNLDSYIGKELTMLTACDFENNGSVKINGVVWSAVSESGEAIEKDSIVKIKKVDGNKLVVEKVIKEG